LGRVALLHIRPPPSCTHCSQQHVLALWTVVNRFTA
jgi:hypothetical protein